MEIARGLVLALLLSGCASSRSQEAPAQAPASAAIAADEPRLVAHVADSRLKELSGLAASRRFPGCFWAHNDSGDSARVFLLDGGGRTRAVVTLEDAVAVDCEDIAVSGSGGNASVILADMGDNARSRQGITLYGFRESDLKLQVLEAQDAPQEAPEISIRARELKLHYPKPDGSQDAEALAASEDGSLLIVTKSTGPSRFYLANWPQDAKDRGEQELKLVGQKQFGSTEPGHRRVREQLVTGADASPGGSRLALVTYASLYVWSLPHGSWGDLDWKGVLESEPQVRPLPALPQCESVAWSGESEVVVSSEGQGPPLWSIPVPPQ